MPSTSLNAALRAETGKNSNRRLRSQGLIPGVLYGNDIENKSISVDPKEVISILTSDSGQNTIFKVKVGKTGTDVLIKDYVLDPVKGNLIHIDLLAVNLSDVMTFQVHIHIVGEAIGVKDFGGVLEHVLREIDVECKASDVPESIVVDVTSLDLNDQVRVRDLVVADGIRITNDPEQLVLNLAPPAVVEEGEEEEEDVLGLEDEGAEPEVLRKGKTDEAED